MKLKLFSFLVLIALLTTIGITYSVHSQLTPKPLRSVLVTSVMSSPQAGSPNLRTWTFARAVRVDGSWVIIYTRNIGARVQYERDIKDYEDGISTIVDDATSSIVQESIPQSEYKHRLTPAVSCKGTSAGQILGLAVNYTEESHPLDHPQGPVTATVESWLVPDLGCFVLQKETRWTRNSDGLLLVDTKETPISVSFQPVDEFFQVPSSYIRRTKEEVVNQLNQLIQTP
jgi:hypothetical protein